LVHSLIEIINVCNITIINSTTGCDLIINRAVINIIRVIIIIQILVYKNINFGC